MRVAPALTAFALLASFALSAHAETPVPPPLGKTPERELLPPEYPPASARGTLALAGAGVFLGWYGLALGSSLLWPDAKGIEDLRIPVAGPFIALRHTGCSGSGDCNEVLVVVRAIATVIDGVGQVGGLAALGEAAFLPTRAPVRSGSRGMPFVVPYVAGADGIELGVSGAF